MLTLQAQLNECREALQAESDEKIALQKSVQYLTEQLEEKQLMIEAITQQRDEVVQKLEQFKVTTMSEIARLRAYATRTVGALMAATNTTNGIRSTPSTTNPMQTKQSQSMSQTQCASDTNNVNTNTNTNTKT
ncbi:hypothetical protein Pelo_10219 [Pelomyxa schiedti]|nr:hypothetical protein Pelo_10219 [Pelomyxa schiedti]